MADVKLHLGDALETMHSLSAQSLDAIITDLPYGTTACAWDTVIPFAPLWEAVKHVLKPRGVFVTTASQPFTSALVMSNLEWFRYCVVWEKSVSLGFLDANRKPLKAHEDIAIFSAGYCTYNPQMMQGRPWKKKQGANRAHQYGAIKAQTQENYGTRYPRSVIAIDNGNNFNHGHPTQKPVALYAYLIRTYTNAGDTVGDFTMGSGTTGVAAVKEGRHFVGADNNAEYYAIAEKRIAEAQLQLPLLETA